MGETRGVHPIHTNLEVLRNTMSEALADVPADADLYLRPAALTAPGPDALPLAGGAVAFGAVEVIAARYGDRIRHVTLAAEVAAAALTALPDPLAARAHAQFERLIAPRPAMPLPGLDRSLSFARPLLMGVLNVTPDSFSDGGRHAMPDQAVAHAEAMIEAGADIIDIGGESTRPGASPVWEGEERDRVLPVIERLAGCGAALSIDSRNASVMEAALRAGAHMLNDVSALAHDPRSLAVAAAASGPVVLMHSRGEPATMQQDPTYDDVLLDVFDALAGRIAACEAAGIDRARLIVDPGIGFAKSLRHNLDLIDGLSLFHSLGCPLLLGVSRKTFIGALSRGEPPDGRLAGSLAAALAGLDRGGQVLRVHDVAETRQAVAVWQGLRDAAMLGSRETKKG